MFPWSLFFSLSLCVYNTKCPFPFIGLSGVSVWWKRPATFECMVQLPIVYSHWTLSEWLVSLCDIIIIIVATTTRVFFFLSLYEIILLYHISTTTTTASDRSFSLSQCTYIHRHVYTYIYSVCESACSM